MPLCAPDPRQCRMKCQNAYRTVRCRPFRPANSRIHDSSIPGRFGRSRRRILGAGSRPILRRAAAGSGYHEDSLSSLLRQGKIPIPACSRSRSGPAPTRRLAAPAPSRPAVRARISAATPPPHVNGLVDSPTPAPRRARDGSPPKPWCPPVEARLPSSDGIARRISSESSARRPAISPRCVVPQDLSDRDPHRPRNAGGPALWS